MSAMGPPPEQWPTVLLLSATADAPSLARKFVETHADGLPASLVEDALLMVSELVTNAVLHGQPDIRLRARNSPLGLGLGVQDDGQDPPRPNATEPNSTLQSGRGLQIVAALASSWGVTSTPPGKIVWFELRQSPTSA